MYHFPSKLVLMKHQDPFTESIFESCLSCSFLVWPQNFSTIQWIVNFNFHFPIQGRPALELQVFSYCLNIGQDRLNIALTM